MTEHTLTHAPTISLVSIYSVVQFKMQFSSQQVGTVCFLKSVRKNREGAQRINPIRASTYFVRWLLEFHALCSLSCGGARTLWRSSLIRTVSGGPFLAPPGDCEGEQLSWLAFRCLGTHTQSHPVSGQLSEYSKATAGVPKSIMTADPAELFNECRSRHSSSIAGRRTRAAW